ncbi:ion channel [Vibrio hannami]|uniref:potassium channel family protein n=1 Tax=Vibrio hannami TaxID=2717094 RepID=UPI00240EBFE8|nr:potassium channel family protein [Vibrio hannami]MDG3089090.1 ion channel [Vibrio hannami]
MKKHHIKNDIKPMSLMSLLLSFLSLFVISGILFLDPAPDIREILIDLDLIICSIFLLQWGIDLGRAQDKKIYLKDHWIDLVASIPLYEPLRYGRLIQILRVVRVIRSSKQILRQIQKNRKEATLASILLLLVVLLTVGSALMIIVEGNEPGANIKSGSDALWWAFVTVSTVGYGDHYPVTNLGKSLAAVIIVCGVGIFGMISGLITSIISSPPKEQPQQKNENNELLEKILEQQQELLIKIKDLEKQLKDKGR